MFYNFVVPIAAWSGQPGFNWNYSCEEHYDQWIIGMNANVGHGVVERTLKNEIQVDRSMGR